MGIMIWLFVLLYYSMKAASRRLGGKKDVSGSKQTLNRMARLASGLKVSSERFISRGQDTGRKNNA